ncbi:MAG: biotin--[acetyl-CoA-carboxylase] ligase [Polyangiales bacterium]
MDDLDGFVAPAACRALGRALSLVAETASTNDDAREAAVRGAPHGMTFVADAQTAGRGRLGRRWHSPPGASLYVSIVLRPNAFARDLALLPLSVGLAVAEAVDRVAPHLDARIKWPNDVLVAERKLAGVLVEGALRGDRFQHVVVGVGLNVRGPRPPEALAGRATTLAAELGRDVARREVLAALLTCFEARFEALDAGDSAAVVRAVNDRCLSLGRRVRVGEREGVAVEVQDDGGMRVVFDDGAAQVFHGSEGLRLLDHAEG